MKYQLHTTKGRKSADTLAELADWLREMQPSSVRIVRDNIEAEVEWDDDTAEVNLHWALLLAESEKLDLTVDNDNIYLNRIDSRFLQILTCCTDAVWLVDDLRAVKRPLDAHETIRGLALNLMTKQESAFWELRKLLDQLRVPYDLTEIATACGSDICATLRVGSLELNLDADGAVRAELVPHNERSAR